MRGKDMGRGREVIHRQCRTLLRDAHAGAGIQAGAVYLSPGTAPWPPRSLEDDHIGFLAVGGNTSRVKQLRICFWEVDMPRNLWRWFIHPVMGYFRRKRFAVLLQLEPNLLSERILDLGGSVHFWEKLGINLAEHDITVLNIAADGQSTNTKGDDVSSMVTLYDGITIPWSEGHFDWIFCNSVIEHVQPRRREKFCSEIYRVGRAFVVQTPAFAFPIEPHFVIPFLHWLPRSIGRRVARFGLWAMLRHREKTDIERYFDEVNLLKLKEFQAYFPTARIVTEWFGFFPKSYTAIERRA
jgi:hypothetical protein